jgi:hypothetical protein
MAALTFYAVSLDFTPGIAASAFHGFPYGNEIIPPKRVSQLVSIRLPNLEAI